MFTNLIEPLVAVTATVALTKPNYSDSMLGDYSRIIFGVGPLQKVANLISL